MKGANKEGKFTRSRNGCWTCKARKRKCDETKPACENCVKSGRKCLGYQKLISFEGNSTNGYGNGSNRLSLKEKLAARGIDLLTLSKQKDCNTPSFIVVTSQNFKDKLKDRSVNKVITDKRNKAKFNSRSNRSQLDELIFQFSNNENLTSRSPSIQIGTTSLEGENNEIDIPWNLDMSQLQLNEQDFFIYHFIYKVVHLFDNLENSPFPKLVLRYCDIELAKSCFITLSSIHIYGYSNDVSDYDQSMNQLDVITNELVHLISYDENENDQIDSASTKDKNSITLILTKLKSLPKDLRSSKIITILILIYVQTMFSILESGRSAISEFLFRLGSIICYDVDFRDILLQDKQTKFLVMLIAWFETLSALSLPDVRKSYLRKFEFEGQDHLRLRSEDITGCPDEIFTSLLDILDLRFHIYTFGSSKDSFIQKEKIMNSLLRYRDYVPYEKFKDNNALFVERLLGAQCWSIASLMYLHRLLPCENYDSIVHSLLKEFLYVFELLGQDSNIKKQSIWPLLLAGEIATSKEDQLKVTEIFNIFYEQNKMGNVKTLKDLLNTIWNEKTTLNDILAGDGWIKSGIALLPL